MYHPWLDGQAQGVKPLPYPFFNSHVKGGNQRQRYLCRNCNRLPRREAPASQVQGGQALRMYSNGVSMRSPEFWESWHCVRLDQASWQEQVREVGGAMERR